jgi:hypothetical protein
MLTFSLAALACLSTPVVASAKATDAADVAPGGADHKVLMKLGKGPETAVETALAKVRKVRTADARARRGALRHMPFGQRQRF